MNWKLMMFSNRKVSDLITPKRSIIHSFNRFCCTSRQGSHIITKLDSLNNVYEIRMNRPEKKNALTYRMYCDIIESLKEAQINEKVNVVVLRGAGDFFSSGNDFFDTFELMKNAKDPLSQFSGFIETLQKLYKTLIKHDKILVAGVNGPAIGVSVAFLGLFDYVYASKSSYFYAPFNKLGILPEACSSYTFPRMMGKFRANEFLLNGKLLSASEALDWGLLSKVLSDGEEFNKQLEEVVMEKSSVFTASLLRAKRIMRAVDEEALLKTLETEMKIIHKHFTEPATMSHLMKSFMSSTKK